VPRLARKSSALHATMAAVSTGESPHVRTRFARYLSGGRMSEPTF